MRLLNPPSSGRGQGKGLVLATGRMVASTSTDSGGSMQRPIRLNMLSLAGATMRWCIVAPMFAWSLGAQAQQQNAGSMTAEQKCKTIADLAATTGRARDNHMSQDQVLAAVANQGPEYVDLVRRLSGVAYAHPEWTQHVLYAGMFGSCMQRAGTDHPLMK
jgi:hypothetical protein